MNLAGRAEELKLDIKCIKNSRLNILRDLLKISIMFCFFVISFDKHLKWLNFLITHFDKGMKAKGYDEELKGYTKEGSGLGDWLTLGIYCPSKFIVPKSAVIF